MKYSSPSTKAAIIGSEKEKMKWEDKLVPEQVQYYSPEALHWFIVGYKNSHSFGPFVPESKLSIMIAWSKKIK